MGGACGAYGEGRGVHRACKLTVTRVCILYKRVVHFRVR